MRADLIERLREAYELSRCNTGDYFSYGEGQPLLKEAADALASQEPAAFIQRDTLDALREDKHAITTVCSGLLKNPFGDPVPLFTSPVVPVAAKAEAEGWMPTHIRNFLGKVQGVCMGVAMSGSNHPNPDGALMELFREAQELLFPAAPTGKGDGQP